MTYYRSWGQTLNICVNEVKGFADRNMMYRIKRLLLLVWEINYTCSTYSVSYPVNFHLWEYLTADSICNKSQGRKCIEIMWSEVCWHIGLDLKWITGLLEVDSWISWVIVEACIRIRIWPNFSLWSSNKHYNVFQIRACSCVMKNMRMFL